MYKLKIVLVRPNYPSHLITPPLSLGYLSAYLKLRNFEVEIIDGLNLDLSNQEIAQKCLEADLVGINCLSAYYPEVIQLCKLLKKLNKTVIIGGPHASALPELTLQESGADYVVICEGEITFAELAEKIAAQQVTDDIPGVYSKNSTKLAIRPLIDNLDFLPFPDWEQLDPRKYKCAPHGGIAKAFPIAPIASSRGCPFSCNFCASPKLWNKKIRFRSPEKVVDEIELLVNTYGVKEIHFVDDNITLKKPHITGICNIILKRKIKVHWALPNGIRVDNVNEELFSLMKKSGCYSVAFGIESGVQSILNNVNKKIDLKTIALAVNAAKKQKILTQGFFIFGMPGETPETMQQTLDFALRLPLDKAQFLLLDILPGTPLWDQYKKEAHPNFEYKSFQEPVWIPPNLSYRQLKEMQAHAFRKFFLRPKQIWLMAKYFKFKQLPFFFKRIKDFGIFNIFHRKNK